MKKPLIILFLLLFAGLCQATLITRVKETERFKTYKEDDDLVKFLRNLVIWNEDMYAALAGRINWLIDRDEFRGDIKLIGDEKKVYWYNGDYYLTIVAPSGLSANYALTWPLNDGDTGQAVITDGSGVLSFSTPAGMGDMLKSTYDSNEDGVVAVPAGGLGVGTLTDGGVLLGSGTGAITPMAVLEDGEIIVGDGTTDPVAESGATARTSLGLGTGNSPQFAGLSFNTNPSVVSSSYKIQVKPNSDNTDYIEFSTTSSTPSISAEGGSSPNLKITASGGTIDFDDENLTTEGKMTAGGFDGIVGGTTPAAGTFTTLVVDSPTLVVNASGYTDKVGIGTSSPDSVFHIKAGTPGTVGSHPAGQLIIQNPADTVFATAVITGYESDGDGNPDQQLWYLGSSSSSNSDIIFLNRRNSKLALGTNGSHRITILGNGNVGINTTTPASKLSINGGLHVGGDSDAGDNNVLVDGNLTAGAIYLNDPCTSITEDGSGNMTFTDAVYGSKTLSEMGSPTAVDPCEAGVAEGYNDLEMGVTEIWVLCIAIVTSSTDWTLTVYEDDDAPGAHARVLIANRSGNFNVYWNDLYKDVDAGSTEFHYNFTDDSGANTHNIRLRGIRVL